MKEVILHQPLCEVASIPNIHVFRGEETRRFFMVILLCSLLEQFHKLGRNSPNPCLPKRTLIIPVSERNSIIVVSTRVFVMIGKIEGNV